MRSKTVLLITSEYPPNICGGLGTHVASITACLSDCFKFEVITREGYDYAPSNNNIRIHPVQFTMEDDNVHSWLSFCRAVVSYVEESDIDFDIIHCHDWMTVIAGIALRVKWKRPLLFNIHLPQSHGLTMAIERLGISASDHVIVNSFAVRHELSQLHNLQTTVTVIPNGVDTTCYQPNDSWPVDKGYILFVGRLVPQKGVGTLLQALAVLLHRIPAYLTIVGDGHLDLFLKRATRNLGITNHVRFEGWKTSRDLVRIYQDAQFVVMPSFYEPFGIVALEAMACARPVIASNTGGLAEIIDDGRNGLLFPPGDYLMLAAKMLYLLQDQQHIKFIGSAARVRAESYSWTIVASEITDILQTIIHEEWPQDRFNLVLACVHDLSDIVDRPFRDVIWSLIPGWLDRSKL